jgi:CRISPR-associated protein Cas8b/Csh1 subtype I-B
VALGRDAKDFKEFIYVTARILKDQDIHRGFLLKRVLGHLENQRNEYGMNSLMGSASASDKRKMMDNVLRSMMLIEFTEEPDDGGATKKMTETQEITREQIVGEIIDAHPSFFNTHSQRAAFLIGMLTGRLMAIQAHDRGSAPFEKKLHNLRFTMKRLQRLYVQVEMKLKAYGHSGSYRDLEQMLAEEIMSAASEDVDDDELSLSFVIGLNQSYKIKSTKGVDEE